MNCMCTHPVTVADPRKAGVCGRCGRQIREADVVHAGFGVEHDGPPTRPRDRRWEQDFAHEAGARAHMPATAAALREFADRRMLPGPWRLPKDLVRDGEEEVADCLSYSGEKVREIVAREDDAAREARELLLEIGADMVRAYWRFQRVRELLGP